MEIVMNWNELMIKGDVSIPNHEGWVDLCSCSFSVAKAIEYEVGKNVSVQPPQVSMVHISRGRDVASMGLFRESLETTPRLVKIRYMEHKNDGTLEGLYELNLSGVHLASFTFDGMNENLALSYTHMELRELSGSAATVGYDCMKQKIT